MFCWFPWRHDSDLIFPILFVFFKLLLQCVHGGGGKKKSPVVYDDVFMHLTHTKIEWSFGTKRQLLVRVQMLQ